METGRKIVTFYDPDEANNYTRNRATLNPTDELVLNDGVLWDVNSGKAVHKFDKFNPNISGVFHPMGLEIIINSEVVSFHVTLGPWGGGDKSTSYCMLYHLVWYC